MREKLIEVKQALEMCYKQGITSECNGCEYRGHNNVCVDALMEDALAVINQLESNAPVQKWITVTERLPEVVDTYLVVVKCKYDWEKEYEINADVATYNPYEKAYIDDCWNTYIDWDEGQQYIHVTHWMPLPTPPEGE